MRNLTIFIIALTLNGCISDRYLMKYYSLTHKGAAPGNTTAFNHSYKNRDTAKADWLLNCLGDSYSRNWGKKGIRIPDSAPVTIAYDGGNHLSVQFSSKDTLVTFLLKVKNKHNYLSVKRKLSIVPIPFFYFYREYKQMLFIDSAGRLVSINRKSSAGWVVFMVAGNDVDGVAVFERWGDGSLKQE